MLEELFLPRDVEEILKLPSRGLFCVMKLCGKEVLMGPI